LAGVVLLRRQGVQAMKLLNLLAWLITLSLIYGGVYHLIAGQP
jgi:hypothetical protein